MSAEAILVTGVTSVAGALVAVWAIVVGVLRREQAARDRCERELDELHATRLKDYERHIERYHALVERCATVIERLAATEDDDR